MLRLSARFEHLLQRAPLISPDPNHRMDHQINRIALPAQFHRHRVDEERHVVADDLDHSMRGLPAVLIKIGVVDMNRRLPRRALPRQIPVGHRSPIEVKRITRGEVLDRHPVVVLADERFAGNALLARQTLPNPRADSVDQLRLRVRRPHTHLDTTF